MRKELLKRSVAIAAAISMIFSNTASAGVWQQKAGNWFVKDEKSGKNLTGWYQDEKKDWYYLEPSTEGEFNGALRAGWLPAGKDWYFLNPIHDGSFGRMFGNTWLWVDGYCYYFDASGKMLAGTKTPDGYTVNGNGQWTVNGVVQYVPGKGIITKKANSNSGSSGSGSSSGSHSGNHGGSGSNGANNGGTNSGGNTGSDTENQQVTLTVKYMDADTKEILDTRVLTGKNGEKVDIEAVEIGGYSVCDGQPASFTFSENDAEIYVLYRKTLLVGGIEIRYVNKENNEIIAVNSVSGKIGETYIVHIPAIDGYKAVTKDEEILTFSTSQQVVTVEYRTIKDGEEKDQSMVPSDRLKAAKADSAEDKEIIHQMYTGIFDYQQNDDGTIELAVYNENPILQYLEEGRYEVNDIVYIESTEDFASGLTFMYQSHDDEYTGEIDGYDADACEVIHAWQVSPFSFFAPGTNIDMTIPVISKDQIMEKTGFGLVDEEAESTSNEKKISPFSMLKSSNVLGSAEEEKERYSLLKVATTYDIKKWLGKSKNQKVQNFFNNYVDEFSFAPNVDASIGNIELKIYIPFGKSESEFITDKKEFRFVCEPAATWKPTITFKLKKKGEEVNVGLEEEVKSNSLKYKKLMLQGIDFDDKGIYPLIGGGIVLAGTPLPTVGVHDLISDGTAKEINSLKNITICIGAVGGLVCKTSGTAELTTSLEGSLGAERLGYQLEYTTTDGWKTEKIGSAEFNLIDKVTVDGTIGFDDAKAGLSVMFCGSVLGMVPLAIGPEVGFSFEDTHGKIKYEWAQDKGHTIEAELKGRLQLYGNLALHARAAVEIAKNEFEFFPIDATFFEHSEDIFNASISNQDIKDTTSIQVYNEQDEFRTCSKTGSDLNKTVHPTINDVGKYSFDCPNYILKQDNDSNTDKGYKVTELHINLPRDMKANEWERLTLPETIKKLKVDQVLTKSCQVDLSKAGNLEEISMENLNNQISSIDLSKNSTLKKVYIASEYLSDLKLPTTNFLEDLRIDGRHGDTFHSLTLPYNCSTLKNLELYRTDIKDLNTSGMRGLENLTVMWAPLWKLDVSKMIGLKRLNIQETGITSLDVSANKELAQLSTSATLEKFTGNGKVMPNMLNLTWYEDAQKTKPITRGTVCEKGQTIYSNLYKGEKITDIWSPNGMLSIDTNTKFRPADEYGNAITDWPGYDSTTGTASAYKTSKGSWNVQLPQYVLDENNHGYKVLGIYFESACWGDVDGSKAPDLEELYFVRSGGAGEIRGELTLPKNLRKFKISHFAPDERYGFKCDFSNALKLEEIFIGQLISTEYNLDFSQLTKLKTLYVDASNVYDPSTFSMKLPVTNSLEEVQIIHSTDGKGTDEPIQLSGLFELKKLRLSGISQEELDLSDQKNLEDLELSHMPIKELDLDMCLKLKRLMVGGLSKLEHLDISKLDGITEKYKFSASSYYSLKTFTGNGFVMPSGSWYLDPEKTQSAYTCGKGETIYSPKYDINVDGTETVSLNVPLVPETASNALRKTDVVSETEE